MNCVKCKKHYPDYEFNEFGMCSKCAYGVGANLPGEAEYIKKLGNNILTPNEEQLSNDYEDTMGTHAEIDKNNPDLARFRKKPKV